MFVVTSFLQYGTSARLVAPLICMPAPESFAARAAKGKHKGRPGLEERSLRRVRFPAPAGNPDGMEQKPYESRPGKMARDHRVRRRSKRPFSLN